MPSVHSRPVFDCVCLIGIGLIGSSMALAMRKHGLAGRVVCVDSNPAHVDKALELNLVDDASPSVAELVPGADLVVLCTPVGTLGALARVIAPHLKPGAVVSDVGSVKELVVRDVAPHLPAGTVLVPAHPIAGTEHSGPTAGKADLFRGRWCILTPPDGVDSAVVGKVAALWKGMGSMVEIMEPAHHDRVLGITSHLPHLIAYTIVDTAVGLEQETQSEVIKFSASGFRDFTRIAASDPVMWRDIFLNNRDAVLEILGRFRADLDDMEKAIRAGDGPFLQDVFTRTRAIRRGIIDAKQA